MRDAGTSVWRAHTMTTERHQPPDDRSLARSCITYNDSTTSITAASLSQDLLQTCKEPIPANKRRFCCDAGDFEEQWFKHDVCLFEWHQSPFGVITCTSSCVVFADRAPVPSSPLVVQITQILQSSGACCCHRIWTRHRKGRSAVYVVLWEWSFRCGWSPGLHDISSR